MSGPGPRPAGVAVFGSSAPLPGEPLYESARRTGQLLAGLGLTVLTGGYGGVMEGASRGARESGGGAVGVICDVFAERTPNPYLDQTVSTPDLYARTRELIERARAFVVLTGQAGTLSELSFLWALERAGCLGRKPVILLGSAWRPVVDGLFRDGILEAAQLRITRIVDAPREVAELLAQELDLARDDRP